MLKVQQKIKEQITLHRTGRYSSGPHSGAGCDVKGAHSGAGCVVKGPHSGAGWAPGCSCVFRLSQQEHPFGFCPTSPPFLSLSPVPGSSPSLHPSFICLSVCVPAVYAWHGGRRLEEVGNSVCVCVCVDGVGWGGMCACVYIHTCVFVGVCVCVCD